MSDFISKGRREKKSVREEIGTGEIGLVRIGGAVPCASKKFDREFPVESPVDDREHLQDESGSALSVKEVKENEKIQ